jgi:lauroyl/myristoyl acyltransferase
VIRARWQARPPFCSRLLWALLIVLDRLPWPWGEHVLASIFMVAGLVHPSRRRKAVAWASTQRRDRRWRLAAAVCAATGLWIARWRLLGLRSPDDFRPHVVVEGEEHLGAVRGGAILLAFHLGPPHAELPLTLRGHRIRHLGWHDRTVAAGWWNDAWRPFMASSPLSSLIGDPKRWPAVLYSARQTLLEGGHVCITADGAGQHELFRVSLSGGPLVIRSGWLALHQVTGAPVLPLLARLDGHRHIVTVHPPLPTQEPDPARRLEAWREIVTSLVVDYVNRFPEQCPVLVHGLRP